MTTIVAAADARFFGAAGPPPERATVAKAMVPYAAAQAEHGVPVKSITRHILGLFNGQPGARQWRRHLSEAAHRPGAGPEVILEALERVQAIQAAREAA